MANVGPGDSSFPKSPEGAPRRVSDARSITAAEESGSVGKDGATVNLPTVGRENPGATPYLRGVEANTGRMTDAGNSYDISPAQPGSFKEMDGRMPGDPGDVR